MERSIYKIKENTKAIYILHNFFHSCNSISHENMFDLKITPVSLSLCQVCKKRKNIYMHCTYFKQINILQQEIFTAQIQYRSSKINKRK